VPVVAERDGGHERNLVFGAAAGLATAALATEVRGIDLDLACEDVVRFARGHRLHHFVVDAPRGRVADPRCRFSASADSPVLAWLIR